jgi:hypothetical protein
VKERFFSQQEYEELPRYEVTPETVLALQEHMNHIEQKNRSLTQAVHDMLTLGCNIYENKLRGAQINIAYPDGKLPGEPDAPLPEGVPAVQCRVEEHLQLAMHLVAEELGVDVNAVFNHLIGEANKMYTVMRRGGHIILYDAQTDKIIEILPE